MSLQRTATIVSSVTALLLLVMKLFVWIISSSISVLSSAIDSLLDLFVSLFNYFAIHNSEKPPDKKFNYWRGKIEALASLFEWIIIILSWFYILYESILKFINKEEVSYLWVSIVVMMISIIMTWCLVMFLEYVAKKTNNLVIESDVLHYKVDLYTNWWIFLSLWIIYFTQFYFIDAIIWIIISFYIIYSAYELINKWYLLLLDVALKNEDVDEIIKIIKSEREITSYHFLRTHKSWNKNIIDVHIVFNKDIKLIDAHVISDKIEEKIIEIDKNVNWIFNIHLDPYDDSVNEKHEKII